MSEKETLFLDNFDVANQIREEDPSYAMLVSVENDPEEENIFWSSIFVEPIIQYNFLVVRMNYVQHRDELSVFERFKPVDSIPSLYYFAPNSGKTITKEWQAYPQPKAFRTYFSPPANPVNPTTNNNSSPNPPVNTTNQVISSLNDNQRSMARIAVQYHDQLIKEQFDKNAKVKDIHDWVATKIGPRHKLFHMLKGEFLPNDPEMTIEQAGLYPSAKLVVQDDESEVFSHPSSIPEYSTPIDDDNAEIELLEENRQNPIDTRHTTTPGCFGKFIKNVFSLFDPWSGFEEKEDFFEEKRMYH